MSRDKPAMFRRHRTVRVGVAYCVMAIGCKVLAYLDCLLAGA
jgi:hypothetical protein